MNPAARHGTQSGWSAHQRRGERPCDPCYRAKAAYDERWRSSDVQQRRQRLKARAQGMAEAVLRHRYPEEYRVEYEKAKRALQEQEPSQ